MKCEIEAKLVDFVQTVTTDPTIDGETDLVSNDVLDSLLLMDLVIVIENELGVALRGDDIAPQNFRTLSRLASLIRSKTYPDTFPSRVAA